MDKFYPPYFPCYIPLPNGKPAAGGKLYAYFTGTNNLAPLYAEDGTILVGSVADIDSSGQVHVLLDPAITYRLKVVPPVGSQMPDQIYDNVRVANGTIVGMENPMTTKGDLIVGGPDGEPDRLGVGADGDILATALFGGNLSPKWESGTKKYRNVFSYVPSPQISDGYLGCLFYLSTAGQTLDLPSAASIPAKSFIDFVFLDGTATLTITPQGGSVLNAQGSAITIGGQAASFYRLTFLGRGDIGGVPTDQWALGGSVSSGGGGGMVNPMDGLGQLIYGGVGGDPTKLANPADTDKWLGIANVGPGRYVPSWKNLPATMQENFSLLDSTDHYDTSTRGNRIYASKVVSNFTAKRTKLGFFHEAGTFGAVLLGVYDNDGNLLATTAAETPTSETFKKMRWLDTTSSFDMVAGAEYYFVAYFTEAPWSLTIDALGMEKASTFDANFIGSASASVGLSALPATLPALTPDSLAFYIAAR